MFGKNKQMRRRDEKDTFLVKTIFPTVQGEGPFAGQPALFLRLAGCNLRCTFCDTDFDQEGADELSATQLMASIRIMLTQVKTDLLIVTGGEPMLQNMDLLMHALSTHIMQIRRVQIETAGTVWPKNFEQWLGSNRQHDPKVFLVVSPKTPNVDENIRDYAHAWKYIVNTENTGGDDGLPVLNTQPTGAPKRFLARPEYSDAPVYVQPMDEQAHFKNEENMQHALELAMKHGYRISLQQHKILKVD